MEDQKPVAELINGKDQDQTTPETNLIIKVL
jgi:hypothetical protein